MHALTQRTVAASDFCSTAASHGCTALPCFPLPTCPRRPRTSSRYEHWGRLVLGDGSIQNEPNNLVPPEFCATANWTQSFDSVWGWSDQNCDDYHISLCKLAAPPPPMPPPPPPSPSPPGPPIAPDYVSEVYRASYSFVGGKARFVDAQATCQTLGGLLVTYTSLAKQQEVEGAYMARGLLKSTQVRRQARAC